MTRILPVTVVRGKRQLGFWSPVFERVRNRLQDDATVANDKRVHAEIDLRVRRLRAPMQQGVLAVHCFERKLEASIGQLIGQGFCRIANRVATFENAVFAQQDDVVSIVVLQVAFDVAALAAFKMVFKHFNRRTRSHS